MKNRITIERSELQQQIDLRNFYMGESAKRNDKDADTTHTACNALVTAVALRFPSISYTIDEKEIVIEFETPDGSRSHLLPVLERATLDYLVNETRVQWLLLRRPEMAKSSISLRPELCSNVLFTFAKLYNNKKIRRRSTNLAGI